MGLPQSKKSRSCLCSWQSPGRAALTATYFSPWQKGWGGLKQSKCYAPSQMLDQKEHSFYSLSFVYLIGHKVWYFDHPQSMYVCLMSGSQQDIVPYGQLARVLPSLSMGHGPFPASSEQVLYYLCCGISSVLAGGISRYAN